MAGRRRRTRRPKPGISVEISGADVKHLRDQSERFQQHYNRIVYNDAIVPTANLVENVMQALASVDSGFLKWSIEQKETARQNRASIKIRPNYRLYDEYFYAPVQEYGSQKRNIQAVRYVRRARQAGIRVFQRMMRRASNRAVSTYKALRG